MNKIICTQCNKEVTTKFCENCGYNTTEQRQKILEHSKYLESKQTLPIKSTTKSKEHSKTYTVKVAIVKVIGLVMLIFGLSLILGSIESIDYSSKTNNEIGITKQN